jgi:hypothetical protein
MRFDNLSELRQAVMNVIFHMKSDQFVQIFDDWVRRHKKCVHCLGGVPHGLSLMLVVVVCTKIKKNNNN